MIEIAFCSDNNYAMPAGVMVYSVCKQTACVHFNAIVPSNFSEENKVKLNRIVRQFGSNIDFIRIDEKNTEGFPVYLSFQPQHISIAAYYRLFLGELLPRKIEKAIYMDCDTICMSSLDELWKIELTDQPLAAVSEVPYPWQHFQENLGYDDALGYFNSGVLLINLKYWRENNVTNDFVPYILENHNKLEYHDQDVLNYIFRGKVKFIAPKFNAIDMLFHKGFNDFPFSEKEVMEARQNPVIVHFTYKNKPWILGGSHTYLPMWRLYLNQTPWRRIHLKPKKAASFKDALTNCLVRLGLYTYHDDYIRL